MPTLDEDCMIVAHREEGEFIEKYRVLLTPADVAHVMRRGYVGATLSVQGKLRLGASPNILATKISFIDIPNNSQLHQMIRPAYIH